MKASYRSVVAIIAGFALSGCGDFESPDRMASQSSFGPVEPPPVIDDGESVPDGTPEATPTQIAGPTYVPRGKCSEAIKIQVLSNPNGPQVITVPENLKSKLFLDSNCQGPSLTTKRLRTNRQPLEIFFRSPVLSEDTLTLNVNGAQSNALTLLSYKEQFLTGTLGLENPGLQLNNNYGNTAKFFELTGITTQDSSATDPQIESRQYASALVAGGTVLASQSGSQYFAFDKTSVIYNGTTVAAKVTAIAHSESSPLVGDPGQACYSTLENVFCRNTSNPGEGFQPVALPAGPVLDLSGQSFGLACAVKGGAVHCWRPDRVASRMELGDNNIGVAIISGGIPTLAQAEFCAVKSSGRVSCVRGANSRDIGLQNITRISTGPMRGFIVAEGEVMGVKFGEIRTTNPSIFRTYLPFNTYFDEMYPVRFLANNEDIFMSACGRIGTRLICAEDVFTNTVPDYVNVTAGEFDLR